MSKKYIDFVPAKKGGTEAKPEARTRGMGTRVKVGATRGVVRGATRGNARGVVREVAKTESVAVRPKPRPVASQAKGGMNPTYTIPNTPFINQAKVTKRPLSKNVYRKKIEATKEGAIKPVAIVSKPEKDSKAGLIIGIVITMILGAAAGTVAFLLLPR